VANKPKSAAPNRREAVEAMRRQQRAAERRKTIAVITAALAVGVALIGLVVVPPLLKNRNDPLKKPLDQLGVPVAQAACDPVIEDKAVTGGEPANHVPDGERVEYPTVPPSNGKHAGNFLQPGQIRAFYTTKDRPPVEKLVHSLEHGHTILWYDSTITGDALKQVEDIAKRASTVDASRNKFIAAPLDEARGKLPEGKHVALSHWGGGQTQKGYRQLCGAPSGGAVEAFVKAHPASDARSPAPPDILDRQAVTCLLWPCG
jgi:hypothetical protein